jgi:D-alanyl-D-alanine carboxypeptidase (penicillin-binding protein 5/6)
VNLFVGWRSGLLLLAVAGAAQAQPSSLPNVEAAAFLIKADQRVLQEKAADRRLAPASLTKIMTALLVLEDYAPERVVTVGRAAAAETGSRLGLRADEHMKVADLLAAALIQSANDACRALAEHVAGSQSNFVARMNRRAQTWGLRNTHFTNACGHDDPKHYSSARDLAVLADRAMALPPFADLVARPTLTITDAAGKRRFILENKNALIGRYPGAKGVKSGFTTGAGKCLIAQAERNDRKVLLVMLNAPNRWWDASDLLDYAFAQISTGP